MISIHIVTYNNPKHLLNAVESIVKTLTLFPYEVLIIENGTPQFIIVDYEAKGANIEYLTGKGNLGVSRGFNYLAEQSHWDTKYILELTDDMFFAPHAIELLIEALNNPELGAACSNMTNGHVYEKHNPMPSDIEDWAAHYTSKEPLSFGYGASNVPWAFKKEFYELLSSFDVWNGPPLPFNHYRGIWDEGLDPSCVNSWTSDWDIHNRILGLGKQVAVIDGSHTYHYDHVSCEPLDKSNPSWVNPAVQNYIAKYGSFEKGLLIIKKEIPFNYHTR